MIFFGIFIKRNFILKHHIRFSKILRWEEDSYFYGLLESYNPKVKEEDSFAYFYSEDDDSITRKNNNAYVREYIGLSALIIKSTLLNKFFINSENKRWEIFVLAIVISYATMYDDIYVKKKNTKRISKILYLLKLMINIFNIDIESPYFKNTIDKYLLIYYTRTRINFSNFYIGNFLNKIQKQENLYGNYQIEGTNTTLEQLLNIYANLN